jgi:hypothetical protein
MMAEQGAYLGGAVDKSYGGLENTNAIGSSGTAVAIDLSTGNVQTVTNSANCTYTLPSGLTSGKHISFQLEVTNGGTFVATFTGVKWGGSGSAPVISSGSGKLDIFEFSTINGGTTWRGFVAGQLIL